MHGILARLLVMLMVLVATSLVVGRSARESLLARVTTMAPATAMTPVDADGLALACGETAHRLARRLGDGCHVIVGPPFVIGGDLSEVELHAWHRETIAPAARAMAETYFAVAPHEPVTILLFAGEPSYRSFAEKLFGKRDVSRFGFYRRHLRTIVINVAAGPGPLRHELTHALMAFDFPDAPDWLDEGLAALHEDARLSDDGSRLAGLPGVRLQTLKAAIRDGRLQSLESLVHGHDFHGPDEPLNYAQARYFCLFLQHHGVLERLYRHFRTRPRDDPAGARARVFPDRNWQQLDAEFRGFVSRLEP